MAGHSVVFSDVVDVYDDAWIFGILIVKAVIAIGEFDKISDFHSSPLTTQYSKAYSVRVSQLIPYSAS